MSNIKQIVINPELFRPKSSSSQTRKTRTKNTVDIKPVIGPTKLKTKLLNKLREHKQNELTIKPNSTLSRPNNNKSNKILNSSKEETTIEDKDEFAEALKFLNQVKKAKQYTQPKTMKIPSTLQKYTPESNSTGMNTSAPYVQLDLPPELDFTNAVVTDNDVMNLQYKTDNEVPYGCLKNGKKKTYRTWLQTSQKYENKVPISNNSNPFDDMRPPTPPKRPVEDTLNKTTNVLSDTINEREHKLNQIKMKLKRIQENTLVNNPLYSDLKQDLDIIVAVPDIKKNNFSIELPDLESDDLYKSVVDTDDVSKLIEEKNNKTMSNISKDKYLKKTYKHKVTLGKHAKHGRVGVLLNSKTTRKNIINAQKELKKTPLNDVRKFLKQKGLIKVGSTAGKDILMKIFEDSMLAGEICNVNKETMLYNFIHSESEK
jgi:hypothetical protein